MFAGCCLGCFQLLRRPYRNIWAEPFIGFEAVEEEEKEEKRKKEASGDIESKRWLSLLGDTISHVSVCCHHF